MVGSGVCKEDFDPLDVGLDELGASGVSPLLLTASFSKEVSIRDANPSIFCIRDIGKDDVLLQDDDDFKGLYRKRTLITRLSNFEIIEVVSSTAHHVCLDQEG